MPGKNSNLAGHSLEADVESTLEHVLGQCSSSIRHLSLSDNQIGAEGAGSLAGVLGQLPSLAHLNLDCNKIGEEGAGRLAEVLGQCSSLAHLDLSRNGIKLGMQGQGGWRDLSRNGISWIGINRGPFWQAPERGERSGFDFR